MQIIPGNAQHIGSRREQQDDFGFSDLTDREFVTQGGVLAIVTDGMGGLALGRDASRIAKQTMLQTYQAMAPGRSVEEALFLALEAANAAVYDLSCQQGQEGEVGTTLAPVVVKEQELYWVSVGDSRIYLCRRGELCQLTTDHDYGRELARLAEAGKVTWEEALTDPNRQGLTSYLGLPQLPEVGRSLQPEPLEAGDRIMLCSDGLYGSLTTEEVALILEAKPQEAAELLIESALAKNQADQDNLTVVILACESERLFQHFIAPRFGLQRWRGNWRQITCAALLGALCSGSVVWVATRYWPPGTPPPMLPAGVQMQSVPALQAAPAAVREQEKLSVVDPSSAASTLATSPTTTPSKADATEAVPAPASSVTKTGEKEIAPSTQPQDHYAKTNKQKATTKTNTNHKKKLKNKKQTGA
jgi:protein phosphatase